MTRDEYIPLDEQLELIQPYAEVQGLEACIVPFPLPDQPQFG